MKAKRENSWFMETAVGMDYKRSIPVPLVVGTGMLVFQFTERRTIWVRLMLMLF